MCDIWQLVDIEGRKKNVYTMWVAADDQTPVVYEMMGFDSLIGSHFDKYLLEYSSYNTDAIPSDTFEAPKSKFQFLAYWIKVSWLVVLGLTSL